MLASLVTLVRIKLVKLKELAIFKNKLQLNCLGGINKGRDSNCTVISSDIHSSVLHSSILSASSSDRSLMSLSLSLAASPFCSHNASSVAYFLMYSALCVEE